MLPDRDPHRMRTPKLRGNRLIRLCPSDEADLVAGTRFVPKPYLGEDVASLITYDDRGLEED